jgi:hypothetical protein
MGPIDAHDIIFISFMCLHGRTELILLAWGNGENYINTPSVRGKAFSHIHSSDSTIILSDLSYPPL